MGNTHILWENADFAEWEYGLLFTFVGSSVEPFLRRQMEDFLRIFFQCPQVPGWLPSTLGFVRFRIVAMGGREGQAVCS